MARRKPVAAVAAVAGLCLVLAACGSGGSGGNGSAAASGSGGGSSSSAAPSMDELYKAAKAAGENTVVVYGIKTQTACYDEFSKTYPGIAVKTQYMVGDTQARLQQEYVSHQNVGDLLRTGNTSMLALIKDGILQTFVPQTAKDLPASAFGPKQAMINDTLRVSGLAYNTKTVSSADAPTSWQDLTDPSFNGKIVMPDPTSPGAGESTLEALLESRGVDEAWVRALAANKPALIKGVQPAIEALKTGEYSVMLGGLDQVTGPALEQGTSLKFVFPVKGATPLTKHYVGLITNAPHPNAAKLLESWLLSKDGQTCLSQKERELPIRQDVPAPEGLKPLNQLPDVAEQVPASFDELDKQTQYLSKFKQIFTG